MKSFRKVTIVAGLIITLFAGCDLTDTEDNSSTGQSNGGTDSLTVSKTGEGFLVTFTKRSSGYGQVIYDDGQYARKLITTNSKGTIFANCKKTSNEVYSCKRSNLVGDYAYQIVRFTESKQYKWYTTEGLDHVKGSIEAVTESNDGILTIN